MAEFVYSGNKQYTLRASGPMPIYGGGNIPSDYIIHSFGADVSDFDLYECTESLLPSSRFTGQGGDLISASFSNVGDRDGKVFTGRAVYQPVFSEEEAEGFNTETHSCVGTS